MMIDIDRPMLAARGNAESLRKRGILRVVLTRFLAYLEKRETRWSLRELTADELRDIGMTPAEARNEINKSWFWD